jgi:Domain of unknown function (DUF4232)
MHQPFLRIKRSAGAASLACASSAAAAIALAATAAPTAAGRATAAATPRCATSQLVVWLDTQPNGAAGSITYNVEFTNLGRRCTLFGYPGVSAVSLGGHQLGNSATRDSARAPHTVTLGRGHTASASVRIVDAGNFPASSCGPTTAAGLHVIPPNTATARTIPFPFAACSRTGVSYLFVRVVH